MMSGQDASILLMSVKNLGLTWRAGSHRCVRIRGQVMERYQPADYSGRSSTSHPKITGQVSVIGRVGFKSFTDRIFSSSAPAGLLFKVICSHLLSRF
jgi:hypothetical protein